MGIHLIINDILWFNWQCFKKFFIVDYKQRYTFQLMVDSVSRNMVLGGLLGLLISSISLSRIGITIILKFYQSDRAHAYHMLGELREWGDPLPLLKSAQSRWEERRVRRERGEGEGRRKKEGEKPGRVFSSSSLLFLGPAVNRQAEEGWASETLFFFFFFLFCFL